MGTLGLLGRIRMLLYRRFAHKEADQEASGGRVRAGLRWKCISDGELQDTEGHRLRMGRVDGVAEVQGEVWQGAGWPLEKEKD
jgi:hypothetical protein